MTFPRETTLRALIVKHEEALRLADSIKLPKPLTKLNRETIVTLGMLLEELRQEHDRLAHLEWLVSKAVPGGPNTLPDLLSERNELIQERDELLRRLKEVRHG